MHTYRMTTIKTISIYNKKLATVSKNEDCIENDKFII